MDARAKKKNQNEKKKGVNQDHHERCSSGDCIATRKTQVVQEDIPHAQEEAARILKTII